MRKLPQEVLFDKRLVKRHIEQGLCTAEEATKFADDSKDVAELGESIDVEQLAEKPAESA